MNLKVAHYHRPEWDFSVEPSSGVNYEPAVWFRISCGPLSGGLFLSNEQATSLANMLLGAAEMSSKTIKEVSS